MNNNKKIIINKWKEVQLEEKLTEHHLIGDKSQFADINDDQIRDNFKNNLVTLRAWSGLKVQEIMEILGIRNVKYFNWEEGKSLPQYVDMLRICRFYNVTIEEMLMTTVNPKEIENRLK